jgi:hypothetical protein
MGLRIACDLDGTLAAMDAVLQREAERLFGEDVDIGSALQPGLRPSEVVSRDPSGGSGGGRRRRPLDRREQDCLWNHVGDVVNFWETLPEIEPGAVARFADVAAEHGWEVLFLTQRPETAGRTAQVQSQRWLQAHGFHLPSVYVARQSRGRIAASLSLDFVIDDRPQNCIDVSLDSNARPVLIWRDSAERLPSGVARLSIQVVATMADAIDQLRRRPTPSLSSPGLLGRLRQALLPS